MNRQIPERCKFTVDDLKDSEEFYKLLCESIDRYKVKPETIAHNEIELIIPGLMRSYLDDYSHIENYHIPDFYLNKEYKDGIKIHVFSDFRPKIYMSDFKRNNYCHILKILRMYHNDLFVDLKLFTLFEIKTYNDKAYGFDEEKKHFYSYHSFRVYWKFGCFPVTEEEKSHYDKY